MSKIVRINEGGLARAFSGVQKLRTSLSGGGNCLWVPEDVVSLGTKYVTKGGVYDAANDGLYGYSQVTVNVGAVDSLCGIDTDGNYKWLRKINGSIYSSGLPTEIRVTTPPNKTSYTDGEAIDYSGMIVKAYDEDGNLWTSPEYPNGVVPNDELIISESIANKNTSGRCFGNMRPMSINVSIYDYIDGDIPLFIKQCSRIRVIMDLPNIDVEQYGAYGHGISIFEYQFNKPVYFAAFLSNRIETEDSWSHEKFYIDTLDTFVICDTDYSYEYTTTAIKDDGTQKQRTSTTTVDSIDVYGAVRRFNDVNIWRVGGQNACEQVVNNGGTLNEEIGYKEYASYVYFNLPGITSSFYLLGIRYYKHYRIECDGDIYDLDVNNPFKEMYYAKNASYASRIKETLSFVMMNTSRYATSIAWSRPGDGKILKTYCPFTIT